MLSDEILTFGCNCPPFASNSNVLEFTVPLLNGLENASTTLLFSPIPVAPFCGVTLTTTGAVVSTPPAVVNELWKKFTPFPAVSSTPFAVTTSSVFTGKAWFGVNVTTAPFTA
jgi:hypothetical protein